MHFKIPAKHPLPLCTFGSTSWVLLQYLTTITHKQCIENTCKASYTIMNFWLYQLGSSSTTIPDYIYTCDLHGKYLRRPPCTVRSQMKSLRSHLCNINTAAALMLMCHYRKAYLARGTHTSSQRGWWCYEPYEEGRCRQYLASAITLCFAS